MYAGGVGEDTGLIVCSTVMYCSLDLPVFLTSNCSHHPVSLGEKRGRVSKTLPDGFTSLLDKTSTVFPRGTPLKLRTLGPQVKLFGILEHWKANLLLKINKLLVSIHFIHNTRECLQKKNS